MRRAFTTVALIVAMTICVYPQRAAAKTVIKLASLVPKDSTWMKILRRAARDIKKQTNGEVVFKFYAGGTMGDEKDVVRKMRAGQLDAAALTAVGLGDIYPELLTLQLPLLFKKYSEIDYVRDKLADEFEKNLYDKGFKFLGWGDIGFIYVFSQVKITSSDDLKKVKLWAWSDDPVGRSFARIIGHEPIALALPDVMPGLQTGKIDTVYNSPLGMISLGWFSKVKYMLDLPLVIGIGANVITKSTWEKLTEEQKKIVVEVSGKYSRVLTKKVRSDNKKAVVQLVTKAGVQIVSVPKAERDKYKKLAEKCWYQLQGKVYSAEMLKKVKGLLQEYRSK